MKKVVILCASVAALAACETTPVQESAPEKELAPVQNTTELKIVSWNIEHLADDIGKGCKPRTEEQYEKLKEYVIEHLDADIIALQEVQSKEALKRVFPVSDWQYVVSTRPDNEAYECRGTDGLKSTPQRTAIVIRKGVNYKKNDDFTALALDNPGLRYGTSISINNNQLTLLNVHMKSGCFVSDYSQSDRKACLTYQQQAPLLESWVNTQVTNQQAMVVLGDFNHRLVDDGNRYWQELSQENDQRILTSSMQNIQSCHPKYKAPIDHIITGPISTQWVVDGSQGIDAFGVEGELTYDAMLSDHCPISVNLVLPD
jgi:endonuclease/exonuclease/phosphatase family metal-dependent hydrolase